jgi:formylmethanofuran dehydrogenase subunit A
VIYNFNPEKDDAGDKIEDAITNAHYVFKTGVPVVVDGEIASHGNKRTLWVDAKVKENAQVMRDIHDKFIKYYTVNERNYEVAGHHYVPNPLAIEVEAAH